MEQLCLQLVLPYEWHGNCLLNELNYVSSPQGLLLAEAQLITAVSPQVPNDALPWTERQGAPATPPACTWLEGALVSTSIKSPLYQLVPAQRRIVFGSSSWILLYAFLQHHLALPLQRILLLLCHLLHISMAVIARQMRAVLTARSCVNSSECIPWLPTPGSCK